MVWAFTDKDYRLMASGMSPCESSLYYERDGYSMEMEYELHTVEYHEYETGSSLTMDLSLYIPGFIAYGPDGEEADTDFSPDRLERELRLLIIDF